MEGNQDRQKVLLKIKKRFVFNVCEDIILIFFVVMFALCFLWLLILIPKELTGCIVIFSIGYLIYKYILLKWVSSRKQVEAEVKK